MPRLARRLAHATPANPPPTTTTDAGFDWGWVIARPIRRYEPVSRARRRQPASCPPRRRGGVQVEADPRHRPSDRLAARLLGAGLLARAARCRAPGVTAS